MPEIAVAEQPGVGLDGNSRPTEDHIVALPHAVVLLDGATSARPDLPSGGWYAGLLAKELAGALTAAPEADLGALLADSIAIVAKEQQLTAGNSPSSTVAIARWTEDRVDGLVLADSPIVACGQTGPDVLADDRLSTLRHNGDLRTGEDVRRNRNAEGGFWVAEADPLAAGMAVRRSWRREDVDALLLASDGVTVGVDEYHLFGWTEVCELALSEGPEAVLKAVRTAELQDPDGTRWPRAKRHDDQALAVVRFSRSGVG